MSGDPDRYEFLVRESHLDGFGHVNNATYMKLFEEARWDFITSRNYGYKEVQSRQKGPVVLEAKLKFRRELKLRDSVWIETRLEVVKPNKLYHVHQKLLRGDGELCCEGLYLCGFFDLKERRLINFTPEWNEIFSSSD